jgi:hypothetical protein
MPALRWPPGCLFAATPRLSLALAPPAPPHPQRALGFRRTPGPQSESWPGYTPAPWRRCAAAPPRAPRDSARPRRARSSHSDATPHCGEEKRSGRDVGVRNDAPVQSDHAHARAPPSPPRFATQALPARTPPAESETKENCSAVVDGHAWLLQRCKVLFSGPTSSPVNPSETLLLSALAHLGPGSVGCRQSLVVDCPAFLVRKHRIRLLQCVEGFGTAAGSVRVRGGT